MGKERQRKKVRFRKTEARPRTVAEVQALLKAGLEHQSQGRIHEAEAVFQEVLAADPNQSIALYLYGRLTHSAGRFDEAASYLARSLRSNSGHVEAHFYLGEALAELDKFADAADAYRSALALNERFPQGLCRLADMLLALDRATEAVPHLHQALSLNGDFAQGHASLGAVHEVLGEIDAALKSYQRALAIDPDLLSASDGVTRLTATLSAADMQLDRPPGLIGDAGSESELGGFDQGNVRLRACRYGRMLYFVNDDYIGRALDKYGEFSESEAALFRQFVRPGMTVIDVGANIGCHTVCMAGLVRPGGQVVAFEPQRLIFQMLCANLANNAIDNVRAFHGAAGRAAGEIKVPEVNFDAGGNYGGVSLSADGWGETVPVRTIDSLELSACDFIKIDVEGMEADVIAGGTETIERCRPLLYAENEREAQSPALIQQIFDLNYRLYWHIAPLFNPQNLRGEAENIFPQQGSINMLGVPKENDLAIEGLPEILSPEDRWR